MTWFDLAVVIVVAAFGTIEARRGASPAAMDCAALVIVGQIANGAHGAFADSLNIAPAVGFAILYVVLGILGILLVRFIHSMTMLSLDTFDPIVGAVFGVASGIAAAHALGQIVLVAGGADYPALAQSALGDEILNFTTYKKIVWGLKHIGE